LYCFVAHLALFSVEVGTNVKGILWSYSADKRPAGI